MQEVAARAAKESRRFALVERAPGKDRQAGGDGAADGRHRVMRVGLEDVRRCCRRLRAQSHVCLQVPLFAMAAG